MVLDQNILETVGNCDCCERRRLMLGFLFLFCDLNICLPHFVKTLP